MRVRLRACQGAEAVAAFVLAVVGPGLTSATFALASGLVARAVRGRARHGRGGGRAARADGPLLTPTA